jgi:hypothetical protein
MVPKNEVEVLDLLENELTELGCEFIGKAMLLPSMKIRHLKLDNNNIGDDGIRNLAVGLKRYFELTKLSLKYCGITESGVQYIQ